MRYLIGALVLMLAACGHGGGSSAPEATGYTLLIADASALPVCSAANEGQLVYVKSLSQFQACSGGAWGVVTIAGAAGATGPSGAVGPSGAIGPAGKDGVGNKIGSSISCTGALQGTALAFIYNADQLDSGDVFINGSIYGNSYSINNSILYSSSQKGYLIAPVLIGYDADATPNGGFFQLSLDRSTLIVSINYKDPDGDQAWTMTPDKCVLNKY